MTQQDAFPLTDYDLPDGVDRHIEAAPQSSYTDPDVLARELTTVFAQDWVMVGRAGLIPEPGDFFTAMFAMARVYGYLAHALEFEPNARLIRPRARYIGK